jgi:hypothetical protein
MTLVEATLGPWALSVVAHRACTFLPAVCRFIPEPAPNATTPSTSSTTEPVPPSCDDTVKDLQCRCLFRLLAMPTAKAYGIDLPPLSYKSMGIIPPPIRTFQPQHQLEHSPPPDVRVPQSSQVDALPQVNMTGCRSSASMAASDQLPSLLPTR